MSIKQVIVIRKDLKMRRGKEIAQGSHASMKFLCDKLRKSQYQVKLIGPVKIENAHHVTLTDVEVAWIEGSFAKVCLQVNSEDELLAIHQKALDAGLVSCLIQDAGKTEFKAPTLTCIAIGPDEADRIDPITGHLSLY